MNQPDELNQEISQWLSTLRTIMLATVDADGQPNASYAPYVEQSGAFYILVSGLARHTGNLLETGRCHAMFIADESSTVNPFARKRLSYACMVQEMDRQDPRSEMVLDAMVERFGQTMHMLRSLPDFRLMQLLPGEGTWVRGFGQAIPVHGGR